MTRPIRALAELAQVSRSTRLFHPSGLLTDGSALIPEDSARFIQELVKNAEATSRTPPDVRSALDVAVRMHVLGIFDYVGFTLAIVQASLTYELALGSRFVEEYRGRVPVERVVKGEVVATDSVERSDLSGITEDLGFRGAHKRREGWRVVGHADFNGSLSSLWRWARDIGLLTGYLNERWNALGEGAIQAFEVGLETRRQMPEKPEGFQAWMPLERHAWYDKFFRPAWELAWLDHEVEGRNLAAHPTIQSIHTPIDSARTIERLARFIEVLWPETTTDRPGP